MMSHGTPLALLTWVVVAGRSSGQGDGQAGGQTLGTSVCGPLGPRGREASCTLETQARTAPQGRPQSGSARKARPRSSRGGLSKLSRFSTGGSACDRPCAGPTVAWPPPSQQAG